MNEDGVMTFEVTLMRHSVQDLSIQSLTPIIFVPLRPCLSCCMRACMPPYVLLLPNVFWLLYRSRVPGCSKLFSVFLFFWSTITIIIFSLFLSILCLIGGILTSCVFVLCVRLLQLVLPKWLSAIKALCLCLISSHS